MFICNIITLTDERSFAQSLFPRLNDAIAWATDVASSVIRSRLDDYGETWTKVDVVSESCVCFRLECKDLGYTQTFIISAISEQWNGPCNVFSF